MGEEGGLCSTGERYFMELAAFEPWMFWVALGVFAGFLIVMFVWITVILAVETDDFDSYY